MVCPFDNQNITQHQYPNILLNHIQYNQAYSRFLPFHNSEKLPPLQLPRITYNMKTTTILLALTSLALKQVSAAALPEPEYHEVSKNEFGSLYSNVPSHQRRDAENIKYHPIDVNEHGTVYSSVAPDLSKRSDAYTPLDPEAAAAFIKDKSVAPLPCHL